ncbi:hypothetical protein FACS189451_03940 [Bacteroidia bacterium]|nr:hypothetical protein FACS189446_1740 [Bacteroidia bacterium]GHT61588.1 hypothetical protein FACS189451_03940 [Bacteroidia bacterium]
MAPLSYRELKEKISIIQVALELGYKFDKTKGVNQPSFVLQNASGDITDRIYIKNPKDNAIQGYWRRGFVNLSEKGDLINFIKENLNKFSENIGANNETDAINKILNRQAGIFIDSGQIMKQFEGMAKIYNSKNFDIDRYERKHNIEMMMPFFVARKINEATVKTFLPFIEIIRDKESKFNYNNLAFPYTIPGQNNIVGYEVRGTGGYKGKAEGSNSSSACWIADFTNNTPTTAKNIYFAESAYDIMAFYEKNVANIDLKTSVFISTGGSFSDKQLTNLLSHFSMAHPNFCFDNDTNGKMYDIRAFCLINGHKINTSVDATHIYFDANNKKFALPLDSFTFKDFLNKSSLREENMSIWKAPSKYKDWNDVLKDEIAETNKKSIFDSGEGGNKLTLRRK